MQKDICDSDLQSTSSHQDKKVESLSTDKGFAYQLRLHDQSDLEEQNWIKTPVLSPDAKIDLSPQQCEETFKFFLLSGDRLSQMTRTYNDMDALMQLLEEKERDLELAARIGQTLLSRNQNVAEQNELLEEKLALALEEASQLRHEVTKKEQLLRIYREDEFSENSSSEEMDNFNSLQMRVSSLSNKIHQLERDKTNLLEEKCLIQSRSKESSENERKLISTTIKQLNILQSDLQCANSQILAVTDELSRRDTEASEQQGEISLLLSQIVELQSKHKQLMTEHEELQQQLNVANHSQFELSQEVQSLENKYHDVLGMLDETREEMRLFRDSAVPSEADSGEYNQVHNWHVPYESSLAAELKKSEKAFDYSSELDEADVSTLEQPKKLNLSFPGTSKAQQNILKIVHSVNKPQSDAASRISMSHSLPLKLQEQTKTSKPKWVIGSCTPSLDSPSLGQPGVPGTSDLQRALEKLTRVGKESLKFVQQTRINLLKKEKSKQSTSLDSSSSAPKLRLVKPLEGSATLHQWKSLADNSALFLPFVGKPVSPGRVITRGSMMPRTDLLLNKANNLSLSTTEVDELKTSESQYNNTMPGTSGVMMASSSSTKLQQTPVLPPKWSPQARSTDKKAIRSIQSSPNLPGLAAALSPATPRSIIHAVSRTTAASDVTTPASLDLSQLHGRDHHSEVDDSS